MLPPDLYRIRRFIKRKKEYKNVFIIFNITRLTLSMILYRDTTIRSSLKGLIKKNGAFRDTRASGDEGEVRATHLYLAQPIRAGLSTVKTSTLTTGDHNRAYLLLLQARARARALSLSPSFSLRLSLFLSLVSLLHQRLSPLLLIYRPPDALSRILSQNFEPTQRNDDREKEKSFVQIDRARANKRDAACLIDREICVLSTNKENKEVQKKVKEIITLNYNKC